MFPAACVQVCVDLQEIWQDCEKKTESLRQNKAARQLNAEEEELSCLKLLSETSASRQSRSSLAF